MDFAQGTSQSRWGIALLAPGGTEDAACQCFLGAGRCGFGPLGIRIAKSISVLLCVCPLIKRSAMAPGPLTCVRLGRWQITSISWVF